MARVIPASCHLLLVWSSVARAQTVDTCDTGEAPAGYVGDGCAGYCTIVALGGVDKISCDLDTGANGGVATAVEAYGTNADRTYSIWGSGGNGASFCCFYDDTASTESFKSS